MTMRKNHCVIAGLALFFFPLLFPGIFLLSMNGLPGGDLPLYHLPHQQFIRENLLQGILPFWNPYVYGGSPEFDNPEMTPLYWTNGPLLLLFGAEMMLKIKHLLHLGLLGLGAFLLFRRLSVGIWLAIGGALTLQISGFPVTKITLPNVGDSATWLPFILFLTLGMRSRGTLGRALAYTLLCGMMTQLFFPQITLTIVMFAALISGFQYFKLRSPVSIESKSVRITHRFLLPVTEGLVLLCLLRYPPSPIPFPEPGWRNAFGGFGALGLAALASVLALWLYLCFTRKTRLHVQWWSFFKWAGLFCLLWGFAAGFAAPQLALTAEMIPQSNQSALDYSDEDFFTGAQAYGSTREFIQQSVLATPKESVNNMALGPLPWGLAALGLLLGFHRRHRLFLLFSIFAALIFYIYMAGPVVFDIFRRLPFFQSFAGLSRYLAFLNFFLVAMAVLCAALCLRSAQGLWRSILIVCLVLGFALNTAILVRHASTYWRKLTENKTELQFGELVDFVKANKSQGGRILVDARDTSQRSHAMIFPLAARIPGVQDSNDPMHTQRYDRWLAAHNDLFGVDYSDYRSSRFFPAPSPYLRALGVRDYLYPPGSNIPEAARPELQETARYAGWRLMRDRNPWPPAWPQAQRDALPENLILTNGWQAEKSDISTNRIHWEIENPQKAVNAALPLPWFPGWRATVNGKAVHLLQSYGFLQSVPIQAGSNTIELVYLPRSFIIGWLLFLLIISTWIVLFIHCLFEQPKRPWPVRPWALAASIVLLFSVFSVTSWPDAFYVRVTEMALAVAVSLCASLLWKRRQRFLSSQR